MGRLTKQERELLAQLSEKAKAEDDDDKDYVIRVRNDKGHEVEMTGARARKFMAQFGVDDDEDEVEETDEETEEETEEELPKDKKPGGGDSIFRRR